MSAPERSRENDNRGGRRVTESFVCLSRLLPVFGVNKSMNLFAISDYQLPFEMQFIYRAIA